jgi:hypothetical protein
MAKIFDKIINKENKCKSCGAKGERAGELFDRECFNCIETGKRREMFIKGNLPRTEKEVFNMIQNKLL